MLTWTRDLPTEPGFYWARAESKLTPKGTQYPRDHAYFALVEVVESRSRWGEPYRELRWRMGNDWPGIAFVYAGPLPFPPDPALT